MGSPVTITPDPTPDQQVTITPDATPPSLFDRALHGAKEFLNQINPVEGIKGAAQLVNHPVKTYMQDVGIRQQILQKAEEAYKRGDYAAAMGHGLYAFIPFAGPNLERSAEQFQSGDIAGGIGSSLGQGVALAAPEAIKGANIKLPSAGKVPQRLYQSALKPSATLPTSEVQSIVSTGLENKIPVSAEGVTKLSKLSTDLSDAVKAQIQYGSKQGATIDPAAVAQRADQIKSKFTNQVNPNADLAAIDAAKKEFLQNNPNPLSAVEAQTMKQGTYAQLKSRAYGELKSSTIEAQKALARGIKEELEQQFPEIKGLNAQQAKLYGLDESLERAVRRIDNHQLLGIGTPIAAGVGAGVAGGPGALVGGLLKAVIDQPEFKSKLAIVLSHASKGGVPVSSAMARVAGYSNALGSAQSAGTTNSQ